MSREKRQYAKRTYHILDVNCDCASYRMVRTSIRWLLGPRCQHCGRTLGPFEYRVMGSVRATGEFDALDIYDRSKKTGTQTKDDDRIEF